LTSALSIKIMSGRVSTRARNSRVITSSPTLSGGRIASDRGTPRATRKSARGQSHESSDAESVASVTKAGRQWKQAKSATQDNAAGSEYL
jgi:hypothetical protein